MRYMIMLEKSEGRPKYVHHDFESAEAEAKRLSEKHDSPAVILAIVARVEKKPVYRIQTEIDSQGQAIIDAEEDELPF